MFQTLIAATRCFSLVHARAPADHRAILRAEERRLRPLMAAPHEERHTAIPSGVPSTPGVLRKGIRHRYALNAAPVVRSRRPAVGSAAGEKVSDIYVTGRMVKR